MKHLKKSVFIILIFVGVLSANAQSRIIKDSLMFTLTKAQIDNQLSQQGVPAGVVGTEYTVEVHKIIFKTLNYDSTPTFASGLALIPINTNYCALPIVSYQHGTIIRKNDAPSRWKGNEKTISLILASNGMISIMPDYHGMGDGPGVHPYQNARTEAFSVIDMIRATKEVCDSMKVGHGNQLFLFGYSQGGHATMAAQRMIQEQLANEMTVTASAPMSGAYDMSGVQTDLLLAEKPYSDPYYLPFLIFGNNGIYNFFTDPADVLKQPYATTLPPLMDGNSTATAINNAMNDTVKRIFRDDLLDSFNNNPNHFFRKFLEDNDVYKWVPNSKTLMYYCTLDEKVPYQNTQKAFTYFKQNGAPDVDTVNSGALMHTDCAQPSFLSAKFWLDDIRDKPLKIIPGAQNSTNNQNNGSAIVNMEGGRMPFTFAWSNGVTTASNPNIGAGVYSYTVTDGNGCTKQGSITVATTIGIQEFESSQFAVYPNPTTGLLNIETDLLLKEELEIKIFNNVGMKVGEYTFSKQTKTIDVSRLAAGVYTLKIGTNVHKNFIKQ